MQVIDINKNEPAKSADVVLDAAKGNYESVVMIGYDKDGLLDARSSTNIDHKAILFLLEVFKHKLLSGDYSDE